MNNSSQMNVHSSAQTLKPKPKLESRYNESSVEPYFVSMAGQLKCEHTHSYYDQHVSITHLVDSPEYQDQLCYPHHHNDIYGEHHTIVCDITVCRSA